MIKVMDSGLRAWGLNPEHRSVKGLGVSRIESLGPRLSGFSAQGSGVN